MSPTRPRVLAFAVAIAAGLSLSTVQPASAADTSAAGAKIKVTKLADLPPHLYDIQGKASELVENPQAMLDLAGRVKKDIKSDFDRYDIEDRTTLRRFEGMLLNIAMLEKDWPAATASIARMRQLTEKEADRLTTAITSEAMIAAMQAPPEKMQETLRAELDRLLAALPYGLVQDELKQSKSRAEIMSRNLIIGGIASSVDTVAATGKLSQDFAARLLASAFMLQYFIPNQAGIGAAYAAVIDAHRAVVKKDIWAERDISLEGNAKLTPVTVGIWDSGVDVAIYAKSNQLWVNPKETPGNGKDDDRNGFVDDVNGIAWTLHSDPTPDLLVPASELGPNVAEYKASMKGMLDLQANLDTPDAQALKLKMMTLTQDQMKPFFEGLGMYGQYAHGTHVAGIAAAGNPAARLLVTRITFDYHMIPEKPTLEQTQKDTKAMVKTVEYLRAGGVRVVNMSWGGDLRSIEKALEQNQAGGTPEERRALARKFYDIQYKGFEAALKKSPDILFVVAAGNSDNDVKFDEVFPSSFRGPNVLVVGAVDQAGEQTGFTSFGNCDVYASGFEVDSYIPGGERMKVSGTSMSAPQATNLAAKLYALNPKLKASEVKDLIVRGADDTKAGDRTFRLLNPKKTVALAEGR